MLYTKENNLLHRSSYPSIFLHFHKYTSNDKNLREPRALEFSLYKTVMYPFCCAITMKRKEENFALLHNSVNFMYYSIQKYHLPLININGVIQLSCFFFRSFSSTFYGSFHALRFQILVFKYFKPFKTSASILYDYEIEFLQMRVIHKFVNSKQKDMFEVKEKCTASMKLIVRLSLAPIRKKSAAESIL